MSRQVFVTRNAPVDAALAHAAELWPEVLADGKLAARVLVHWHQGRQADSRKAAQERTDAALTAIEERLGRIERRLGIGEDE